MDTLFGPPPGGSATTSQDLKGNEGWAARNVSSQLLTLVIVLPGDDTYSPENGTPGNPAAPQSSPRMEAAEPVAQETVLVFPSALPSDVDTSPPTGMKGFAVPVC